MPPSLAYLLTPNRLVRHPQLLSHGLLLAGVALVVGIFYWTWFGQGGFTIPVWVAYGREVVGVMLQYYLLVWVLGWYAGQPIYLLAGLLLYYWLACTYYFVTAVVMYEYTGVDDFSGLAYHFIIHRHEYWATLVTQETLMRMLRFPMLITIFPLLLRAIQELYRRQVGNAELRQQNAQLELNYLKSQVNPHFLFNILNSIYALAEEESPRAAQLVAQLSGLMRYALYETGDSFVALSGEVSFLRNYVSLEQTRTTKRLTLTITLPDAVDDGLYIAPYILVIFVENAFKHGVATTTRKTWVSLSVQIEGDRLVLVVANSKPAHLLHTSGGVGLANVRQRLALLYPDKHTLTIDDQPSHYRVTLAVRLNRGNEGNHRHFPD